MHVFRGQGEAVTAAELLEEAVERGEGIRLNWSDDDVDEIERMRPFVQDQFPAAILPRVAAVSDEEESQDNSTP